MKKFAFLLTAMLIISLLCLSVFAASGEEILKNADLYLKFDESLVDESGNYTVVEDGDAQWTDGHFGKAFYAESGVNSVYVDGLKFGTDSFTVTAWIKVDEHDGDPCLFSNKDWSNGGNCGWLLCCRTNDLKFNANTLSGTRTDTEYAYASFPIDGVDDWFHVAVTVDRTEQVYCLYINGVRIGDPVSFANNGFDDWELDDEINEYPFYISEGGTGTYNMGELLKAEYDEFAVFKSVLTEDEIVSIYTYAPDGYESATVVENGEKFDYELTSSTTAADVLASADVYVDFENGISDVNGHSITVNGDVPTVEGQNGNGVSLKGNLYFTVDDYSFGTDSFTISTWLKANSMPSGERVAFANKNWKNGNETGWLLELHDARWRLHFVFNGKRLDSAFPYSTSPMMEKLDTVLGTWYNATIVIDREANTYMFYINGYPMTNKPQSLPAEYIGQSFDTGNDFVVGDDTSFCCNSDSNFDFDYDDFAIFKRALTADEVAALAGAAYVEPAAAEEADPAEETVEEAAPAEEAAVETAEESAPAEEAVAETAEEAAPAEETAEETAPAAVSAPQTFDVAVIAAVSAVISAAGYALSRKKH